MKIFVLKYDDTVGSLKNDLATAASALERFTQATINHNTAIDKQALALGKLNSQSKNSDILMKVMVDATTQLTAHLKRQGEEVQITGLKIGGLNGYYKSASKEAIALRQEIEKINQVLHKTPKVNWQSMYGNTFVNNSGTSRAAAQIESMYIKNPGPVNRPPTPVVMVPPNTVPDLDKTTTALDRQTKSVANSLTSWKYWARFFITQTAHKAVYDLINATRKSLSDIIQLQIKISEIRTIGQESPLSFNQWQTEIRKLSDTYGATMEQVTEGIYQTISNQVASGAKAIRFMTDAIVFARTTVGTTEQAVNLTSSAINAYNMSMEQSNMIQASFFKTVEIGRLRMGDIASSFGNVMVTAAELGVELDTVNAMLATMTLQGKNVDVSQTQIRNIMMKLLKPTEELGKFYRQIGVESGEAAISAYGFMGLLKKINDEASKSGNGTTWLAKMFGDIRPISGILSITGDKMEQFNKITEAYVTKQAYYFKATQMNLESSGKRLQMNLNQTRNYFIDTLGSGTLNILDALYNKVDDGTSRWGAWGIASNMAGKNLTDTIKNLVSGIEYAMAAWAGYKLAMMVVNTTTFQKTMLTKAAIAAELEHAGAINGTTAAMGRLSTVGKATAIVGSVGFAALAYGSMKALEYIAATEDEYRKILAFQDESVKKVNEGHFQTLKQIEERTGAYQKEAESRRMAVEQGIATQVKEANDELETLTTKIIKTNKDIADLIADAINATKKEISVLDGMISKLTTKIDGASKYVDELGGAVGNISYYSRIVDQVGKIDDAWTRAHRALSIYSKLIESGKTVPHPDELRSMDRKGIISARSAYAQGRKLVDEDPNGDIFTKKKNLQKQGIKEVTMFEVAQAGLAYNKRVEFINALEALQNRFYREGDTTQARKFGDAAISEVDKLQSLGIGLKAIMKIRDDMFERRKAQEELLIDQDLNRLQILVDLRNESQKHADLLHKQSQDSGNDKALTETNISKEIANSVKRKTELENILANAPGSVKDRLTQKQMDLSDIIEKSRTSAITNKLETETAKQVKATNEVKISVDKQVKFMAQYASATEKLANLTSVRDEYQRQTTDVKKQMDAASAKALLPQNMGAAIFTSLTTDLKKFDSKELLINDEDYKRKLADIYAKSNEDREYAEFKAPSDAIKLRKDFTKSPQEMLQGFQDMITRIGIDINKVKPEEIEKFNKVLRNIIAFGSAEQKKIAESMQSQIMATLKAIEGTSKYAGELEKVKALSESITFESVKKALELLKNGSSSNVDGNKNISVDLTSNIIDDISKFLRTDSVGRLQSASNARYMSTDVVAPFYKTKTVRDVANVSDIVKTSITAMDASSKRTIVKDGVVTLESITKQLEQIVKQNERFSTTFNDKKQDTVAKDSRAGREYIDALNKKPDALAKAREEAIEKNSPQTDALKKEIADLKESTRLFNQELTTGKFKNGNSLDADDKALNRQIIAKKNALLAEKEAKLAELTPNQVMAKATEDNNKQIKKSKVSDMIRGGFSREWGGGFNKKMGDEIDFMGKAGSTLTQGKKKGADWKALGYPSLQAYREAMQAMGTGDWRSSPINMARKDGYISGGQPTVVNVVIDGKVVGQAVVPWLERGSKRGQNNLTVQRNP